MTGATDAEQPAGNKEQPPGTACKPRLEPGDRVSIELYRSDPIVHFQRFEIAYTPRMRVLDALNDLADQQTPDLAYRWLCGSKMCGTCAVRVNGREVLAWWEPVEPRASDFNADSVNSC